jgi:hypothetical protein
MKIDAFELPVMSRGFSGDMGQAIRTPEGGFIA